MHLQELFTLHRPSTSVNKSLVLGAHFPVCREHAAIHFCAARW